MQSNLLANSTEFLVSSWWWNTNRQLYSIPLEWIETVQNRWARVLSCVSLKFADICSKRSSDGSSGSGTNESSNSWAPFIPRSPSARNSNLFKSPLVRRLDSPHEKYHKYSITIHKFKKAHKDPQGVNVDVYGYRMLHNVTHSYTRAVLAVLAVFKTRRVISVYMGHCQHGIRWASENRIPQIFMVCHHFPESSGHQSWVIPCYSPWNTATGCFPKRGRHWGHQASLISFSCTSGVSFRSQRRVAEVRFQMLQK